MVVADDGGGAGDQAGQRSDELACLVQVLQLCCGSLGESSASPHLTAAADIKCTAADVMTSMAGTSAMSRVTSATASAGTEFSELMGLA